MHKFVKVISLCALFILCSIFIALYLDLSNKIHAVEQYHQEKVELNALLENEKNTINIFSEISPQVVFVHNLSFVSDFFSFNVTEVQQGTGSGFIWDNRGHIVTNYHVVQGADKISVTLSDGMNYSAKIIGIEVRKDIAVLKIDKKLNFNSVC